MSAYSDMIRSQFSRSDAIRDAGLTTPQDIIRYDNISYGQHSWWHLLDVYRPRSAHQEKLPVIVSVHGGGWVYGSKETYQFYCMNLAQRGFAVVNFNYRLAPEFKFPSPLEDTSLVFTWVLHQAEEYGFDQDNIFAVGDSAGAHTLALYCAICTNPDYAAYFRFPFSKRIVPKAIALNCGKYRIVPNGSGTQNLAEEYLPQKGTAEELRRVDVAESITSNFPPVFLMTSTGDFLKQESLLFAQQLMDCEVPFLFRVYGDAKDKPGHVFHCNIRSDTAAQCNNAECIVESLEKRQRKW